MPTGPSNTHLGSTVLVIGPHSFAAVVPDDLLDRVAVLDEHGLGHFPPAIVVEIGTDQHLPHALADLVLFDGLGDLVYLESLSDISIGSVRRESRRRVTSA